MTLSFSEKRGLQKTVATNLAGLAAGGVAFQEKRRMQKEISDAIVRLGEKAIEPVIEPIEPEPNSNFTENALKEMVNAITNYGGEVTGKQIPDVFFMFAGGVSAKLSVVMAADKIAGFISKNIDIGEESSLLFTADQAMEWLMGNAKDNDAKQYQQNSKLADLLSGKYNDEKPEVFIKLVKDVIDEIKEIDPVKPALLSYIEAAKAKGIISESAIKALESILES